MPRKNQRLAVFHPEFREDLRYWIKNNRKLPPRVVEIVAAVLREPCAGPGKPEPLKHLLAGAWSRRITEEHRLVCRVSNDRVDFLQARYHY